MSWPDATFELEVFSYYHANRGIAAKDVSCVLPKTLMMIMPLNYLNAFPNFLCRNIKEMSESDAQTLALPSGLCVGSTAQPRCKRCTTSLGTELGKHYTGQRQPFRQTEHRSIPLAFLMGMSGISTRRWIDFSCNIHWQVTNHRAWP